MPTANIVILLTGLALSALAAGSAVQMPEGTHRVSDSILVVNAEGTNCIVIEGAEQLAVIDTGPGPAAAETVLDAIDAVFGRSDVAFVVSTHCHWDHVDGNQVFSDALIVAHSRCPTAMRRAFEDRRRLSAESEPSTAPPPPPPGVTLPPPEGAATARVAGLTGEGQRMQTDLKKRFDSVRLSLPMTTFTDGMSIDLGGRALSLIEYGGGHSATDILVVLPEDGVLFSGDLFFKGQLPLITGDGLPETSRWMVALDRIDELPDVRIVIPGHGELMTSDDLRFFKRYIRWLVSGIESANGEGADYLLKSALKLENLGRPWPEDLDLEVAKSVHQANVEALLRSLTAGS